MSAHTMSLFVHLVGLILGLGGAVLTDVIFITCVRSSRAGRTLMLVLKTASNLVIVGYILLVGSGVALLATGSHTSSKFWAKMVVVLIIGINGTVAHKVVFPKLRGKIRRRDKEITIGFLHQISVVSAVSIVSWITALILGAWKTTSWPIVLWVGVYFVALVFAIAISLLITPIALRVDHPEFDDVFPVIAARANRASMVYYVTQRGLPVPVVIDVPPQEEEPLE